MCIREERWAESKELQLRDWGGGGGGVRRVLSEKHSVSEWLPVSIIVNNILVRSLNFL